MSDPLPPAESRWLFRRLYVFASTGGLWLLLRDLIARAEAADLSRLIDGVLALQALVLVLYLVAPTAEQVIAVLAQLRLKPAGGGR